MRIARCGFALSLALAAGSAAAHPIHEVVQNAYVTLAPGRVDLQLELTAGPQVAGRIIGALDANRDGAIGTAEARGFAARVLAASSLTVDRHPLALRLISVDMPSYAALRGAHGTIRIVASAARADRAGGATLAYRNAYSPAESRCDANIFLKPAGRLRYAVKAQSRTRDGRALTVDYVTTAS